MLCMLLTEQNSLTRGNLRHLVLSFLVLNYCIIIIVVFFFVVVVALFSITHNVEFVKQNAETFL